MPTLEAMTCGAAVITTDTGGMRDFVVDGENALVINHHDKKDMKSKIENLINHRDLMNRIAHNGMVTASKFNWDNTIIQMEKYFRKIAKYKIKEMGEKNGR